MSFHLRPAGYGGALALSAALLASSARAFGQQPPSLGQLGIAPTAVYDGAAFGNFAGGARRSAAYSGNLALRLTVDLERLMRWSGATFYVGGVWIHGGQPSRLAGDAQGVSNISAPAAVELEELCRGAVVPSQVNRRSTLSLVDACKHGLTASGSLRSELLFGP